MASSMPSERGEFTIGGRVPVNPFDPRTERELARLVVFDRRDVPTAIEHREHLRLVRHVHLLDGDVATAGLDRLDREIEGRRAGSTGVFDRVHGYALEAAAAHRDGARDDVLPLRQPVGGPGVVRCLHVGPDFPDRLATVPSQGES